MLGGKVISKYSAVATSTKPSGRHRFGFIIFENEITQRAIQFHELLDDKIRVQYVDAEFFANALFAGKIQEEVFGLPLPNKEIQIFLENFPQEGTYLLTDIVEKMRK